MEKKTTYPHELIGQEAEVIEAHNKANVGLKGKIVDETKSTLTILQAGKLKKLLKQTITLKIKSMIISGSSLTKRSEERIKG